jgi:RNA polymerase sigma-70 factor (ECF subfamily)
MAERRDDSARPRNLLALEAPEPRCSQNLETMLPLVYAELKRIAARRLRGERRNHTLQPTTLVHEVYLRLAGGRSESWKDRTHFLAVAAKAMRGVLVDHARRRRADKRGRGFRRVTLRLAEAEGGPSAVDVLELHEALERLAREDARKAAVVELRFFGGMSLEETAEALEISTGTVKRHWTAARAWLFRELYGDPERPEGRATRASGSS